jgi:hypothetical protein
MALNGREGMGSELLGDALINVQHASGRLMGMRGLVQGAIDSMAAAQMQHDAEAEQDVGI